MTSQVDLIPRRIQDQANRADELLVRSRGLHGGAVRTYVGSREMLIRATGKLVGSVRSHGGAGEKRAGSSEMFVGIDGMLGGIGEKVGRGGVRAQDYAPSLDGHDGRARIGCCRCWRK